ncbi:MAG: DNA polymerase III subunit beta [Deltaproteobacteria bacterium]|nr:DNA polymerase III subunit beta [Deltaproteobacteria bacterium]
MEIKIEKEKLLNLLRWTQGIVEKRSPMVILSNLLLEAQDKNLRVTATDLEVVVTTEGEIDSKGSGRWVVSARHFFEIVREAPTTEIKLVSSQGKGLEIRSGKAHFKVVGMNPDEFPQIPPPTSKGEVKIDPDDLKDMIENTFYSVSTDETRYTLNALYFTGINGTDGKNLLRLVATDGHRLSYSEKEVDKKWKLEKGILLPRKGVQELKKLLSEGEGDVFVTSDEKIISFRRGGVSLSIRLTEGEYPQYEQVIPKETDKVISVERDPFAGSLRRASILTAHEGRGVRLEISSGILEVSSAHADLGEAKEELAIDYRGPKFDVAFNPKYLLDILSVLQDEKVVLELKDDVSPCVIRSEFDRGFLALVMPMRI